MAREKLVIELGTTDIPTEDFQEGIDKLMTQSNPENTEVANRKLIFLARNNADEQTKRLLMPIRTRP